MKSKILYLIILVMLIVNYLSSQTIVPTDPKPKNALLEEFTGINCSVCPSGHEIAHNLMQSFPNRFFTIAYHVGSYAAPGYGQPDYRTEFGSALANQSGLTGYPAGTVNRHVFPGYEQSSGHTAMSRGNWDDAANIIMAQTSPVNIAIDMQLDYATRILTLLVEVYYTANADSTTNKLNIAILQNYIKGPQAGASSNPDFIAPDGQYYHMHMLRTLITGQWGIPITPTTNGTFYDSTFIIQIPTTYNNIPVDLSNLEVVSFVSEGRQEVLTATGAHVPLANIDVSAVYCSAPPFLCTNITDISCIFKNNGTQTVSSMDVYYQINGATPQMYSWTGTIDSDSQATIVLTDVFLPDISNNLKIWVSNINNSSDENPMNDTTTTIVKVFSTSYTPPYYEGFTSSTFPPTNMVIVDAVPDGINWKRSNAGHNAAGSAFINFYSISSNKIDDLIIQPLNLSSFNEPVLTFYVAYRQYESENDKLQVDVSTNCLQSWENLWMEYGSNLATCSPSHDPYLNPASSEWYWHKVSLSNYKQDNVTLRFRATSNYGNNLFLDDINIAEDTYIPESDVPEIKIYPNPASDYVTFILPACNTKIKLDIYDILGNIIHSGIYKNNVIVSCESWTSGIYTAIINTNDNIYRANFIIKH
ncbi:MAG: Omp28-related outer membrane protein [Bacteroidales bacterium]|nr:Omp28-related outer membrane protein [Bacteroidales bacterium]